MCSTASGDALAACSRLAHTHVDGAAGNACALAVGGAVMTSAYLRTHAHVSYYLVSVSPVSFLVALY